MVRWAYQARHVRSLQTVRLEVLIKAIPEHLLLGLYILDIPLHEVYLAAMVAEASVAAA